MSSQTFTSTNEQSELADDRQLALQKLRDVITQHLPSGFIETTNDGMINFVVPHLLYPAGYHCDPTSPLPFVSIAARKNYITLHHMGLYADKNLMNWFETEYQNRQKRKLAKGKSCFQFKKTEHLPFELIGELAGKMTAEEWITLYEQSVKG